MATRIPERCAVCGIAIHSKDTITWVDQRAIHVMCFRPGLSRKPRKSSSLGVRGGRVLIASPAVTPAETGATPLESRSAAS